MFSPSRRLTDHELRIYDWYVEEVSRKPKLRNGEVVQVGELTEGNHLVENLSKLTKVPKEALLEVFFRWGLDEVLDLLELAVRTRRSPTLTLLILRYLTIRHAQEYVVSGCTDLTLFVSEYFKLPLGLCRGLHRKMGREKLCRVVERALHDKELAKGFRKLVLRLGRSSA